MKIGFRTKSSLSTTLTAPERQCLRFFALFPPGPRPLPNLQKLFGLDNSASESPAEAFISGMEESLSGRNTVWNRCRLLLRKGWFVSRQLLIFEQLSNDIRFEKILESLQRKKILTVKNGTCEISDPARKLAEADLRANFDSVLPAPYRLIRLLTDPSALFFLPQADYILKNFRINHPILGQLATAAARLAAENDDFEKAARYQLIDLEILHRLRPAGSVSLAVTQGLTAFYFYRAGRFGKAKELIESSVAGFRQNFPSDHEEVRKVEAWRRDILLACEQRESF